MAGTDSPGATQGFAHATPASEGDGSDTTGSEHSSFIQGIEE